MPELPEVESVRLTLSPLLEHKSISSFELFWPKTVASPAPEIFCCRIKNGHILKLRRRGKYIVIPLSSGNRIAVHLRMTGELRYVPPDTNANNLPDQKHLRALFHLNDESALAFFDIRKFGRITLLQPDEWEDFQNQIGIEPLSRSFTDSNFHQILLRYRKQIKALLLDQRVIAGLGNIYIDEALYLAKIHPRTISSTIDFQQACNLRAIIVEILLLAIKNRGTTFSNYRDGLGESGTNQDMLQIYGKKAGSPCLRCGAALERTIVAQRGTIYCPACQGEPANSPAVTQ